MPSRRRFLAQAAVLAVAAPRGFAATPRFEADPFTLGVASGYPSPDGFVLWTRLAPEPFAPGGGMAPVAVPVHWEVAEDEHFGAVVASGTSWAEPAWGHSVHVETARLAPGRAWFYRFHCGDATSAVGRTRTAPAADASPARLRFAVASCQHFEHGHYAAYRHMLDDELDFVLHLGDYIYESTWGPVHVRSHEAVREPTTLEDYRAHYACYRGDRALQAMHAAVPWLLVWDDHEVENDYANDRSQNLDPRDWFLARRAAAYQAYYEHMPLPRSMLPFGPDMRIHTTVDHGRLARFYLLDDRQYRSYQPCPRPGRGGSNIIEGCAAIGDPAATMLGAQQEAWFAAMLGASKSAWNLVGQQTLIGPSDGKPGPGERWYTDIWDGYPAARRRFTDSLVASRAANPVTFGGDVHSFWVNDLKRDFTRPESDTIATEFVTTSISSNPAPEGIIENALAANPGHIRYAVSGPRGYLRVEVTAAGMHTELRALDDVTRADSGCATLKRYAVTAGRAGAEEA
ncbi:MAG: alkaline phosphatase D family protein [Gammaproteobacteria bacterium]|nr:alkaline phosphatase D family protein [Gammaproteobacteria bacterium]